MLVKDIAVGGGGCWCVVEWVGVDVGKVCLPMCWVL